MKYITKGLLACVIFASMYALLGCRPEAWRLSLASSKDKKPLPAAFVLFQGYKAKWRGGAMGSGWKLLGVYSGKTDAHGLWQPEKESLRKIKKLALSERASIAFVASRHEPRLLGALRARSSKAELPKEFEEHLLRVKPFLLERMDKDPQLWEDSIRKMRIVFLDVIGAKESELSKEERKRFIQFLRAEEALLHAEYPSYKSPYHQTAEEFEKLYKEFEVLAEEPQEWLHTTKFEIESSTAGEVLASSQTVSQSAIYSAGMARDAASAPGQEALRHPDARIRGQAAYKACRSVDMAALPTLKEMAKNDPDWKVRNHIISSLGYFPESEVKELLVSIVQSSGLHYHRISALGGLSYLMRERSVPILISSLKDVHPEVRIAAAQELARWGDLSGFEAAYELCGSSDGQVRRKAVETLGFMPGLKSEALLEKISADFPGGAVKEALIAKKRLTWLKVPPSQKVSFLKEMLYDQDRDMRSWAAHELALLGKEGDKSATQFLVDAILNNMPAKLEAMAQLRWKRIFTEQELLEMLKRSSQK